MSTFLPVVMGGASAVAAFFLAYLVFALLADKNRERSFRSLSKYVNEKGEAVQDVERVEESTTLLKLGRRFMNAGYSKNLTLSLQRAGQFGSLALDSLIVRKMLFAGIGLGIGLLMFGRGISVGLASVLILTLVGFFVPDLLLISTGQNRLVAIDRGLPDAIDLLALCVESGLSFEAAASRVSINLDGPVAEEFGALLGEIQLGKSRGEALTAMSERTKSVGLARFTSALLQVDRLGIPVATVLQEQAREMRKARKDLAREQAQKVTVKILAPLMVCLLPAVFIVVIGPALVSLFTGLGSLGS